MHKKNEQIEIKKLGPDDSQFLVSMISLFQEVFEMDERTSLPETYFRHLLLKPDFIAYAAISNNLVVAGLTAYELPLYYTGDSEIFLYDIAVKAEFQRKGLGQKLLSALRQYAKQNGIKEIFTAAEEADEHALEFYRATGGAEQRVSHFNYRS